MRLICVNEYIGVNGTSLHKWFLFSILHLHIRPVGLVAIDKLFETSCIVYSIYTCNIRRMKTKWNFKRADTASKKCKEWEILSSFSLSLPDIRGRVQETDILRLIWALLRNGPSIYYIYMYMLIQNSLFFLLLNIEMKMRWKKCHALKHQKKYT